MPPRKSLPKEQPTVEAKWGLRTDEVMPREWAITARWFIAIDPGLQGTGIAIWRDGILTEARVISVPSKLRGWPWPARADFIADAITHSILPPRWTQDLVTVVSEFPEGFGGVKMMAWQTGDLQRLTYLVGLISGRVADARFVPIPVHAWKGQLPKNIVEDRLRRRMGPALVKQLNPTLHAWDAIGIGMWARGEF